LNFIFIIPSYLKCGEEFADNIWHVHVCVCVCVCACARVCFNFRINSAIFKTPDTQAIPQNVISMFFNFLKFVTKAGQITDWCHMISTNATYVKKVELYMFINLTFSK